MDRCDFFCKGVSYFATGELVEDSYAVENRVRIFRADNNEQIATRQESASTSTIVGWFLDDNWDILPAAQ